MNFINVLATHEPFNRRGETTAPPKKKPWKTLNVLLGLSIKKWYQNYLKKKTNTYKAHKTERLKNAVLDLAQIRETVTQLNVGNKLQVTQMHSSHATCSWWFTSPSGWNHPPVGVCYTWHHFLLQSRGDKCTMLNLMQVINIIQITACRGNPSKPFQLPTPFETMETFWSPLPVEESQHCSLLTSALLPF